MFDPTMFNAMGEMMKNPEMMKQMEEMMKNPDVMDNAMKMMNNPNMANLFGGLNNQENSNQENNDNDNDNKNDNDNNDNIKTKYNENDVLLLVNLKSESFNNKECIVKSFNKETNRYYVFIKSLDRTISVKEENLEQNCEIITEVD